MYALRAAKHTQILEVAQAKVLTADSTPYPGRCRFAVFLQDCRTCSPVGLYRVPICPVHLNMLTLVVFSAL
jgi:hypothetical protein